MGHLHMQPADQHQASERGQLRTSEDSTMKGVLTLVLLVLAIAVQSGLGLRCWECLADCGDLTNHQEEQCDQDVEYCLRLRDGSELTLSCAPDPPTSGVSECRHNGDTEQCFCGHSLCNAAPVTTTTTIALVLVLVLATLAHQL